MFTEEEKLNIINHHLRTLSLSVKTELTTNVGRQLVAARDIKAGEVIFSEETFVPAIPRPDTQPVCLSCLRVLPVTGYNCCSCCGVPLCSDACEANRHSQDECHLLSRMCWQSTDESPINIQELNLLMTPLRTLVYLDKHPELAKIVWALDDGAQSRAKFNETAIERHKKIVGILKSKLNWEHEDVEEKAMKILGIYDVSGFDIPFSSGADGQEAWGRALFPGTAMMNHSCVPNTHNTFTAIDKSMLIRATIKIPQGTPICINYSKTKLMWGNQRRREYFEYKWFFTCNCARCSDPTELGSHISSVKCKHCGGLVVPPDDGNSTAWTCSTCDKTVSDKAVDAALTLLGNSFAKVSNSDVKALRRAAIVVDKILGPQIFLSITFKHQIVKLIMEKHTEDCSLSELWCVVDMTNSLLDLATRLAPGMSYLRGDMLYKHIRAALEILLRAKKDKTETLGTTNNDIKINDTKEDKQELVICDIDITSRKELIEEGITSHKLLPTDSKSKNFEDRLKFRWKELDVKALLESTKEAQDILKYSSFYAKEILLDTDYVIELFQELLQTDV